MLTSLMLILPRFSRGVAFARTLWSADFVPALTIAAYTPHIPPGLNAATFKKVFMIKARADFGMYVIIFDTDYCR